MKFVVRTTLFIWITLGILGFQSFASAAPEILTSFGSGPTKVRIYTDYFCGPCQRIDPQLDPIISKLVSSDRINITFIDTAMFKYSTLYATYFLYAAKEVNDLENTLRIRALLFEAAKSNITDTATLETYLKWKKVNFQPMDVRPIFASRDGYLRSDNIHSTPSCVIERGDKKEVYKGSDIINALKRLE